MGEIADSIIDGEMCQVCGCYMGGGAGFPRTCSGCGGDDDDDEWEDFDSYGYASNSKLARAVKSNRRREVAEVLRSWCENNDAKLVSFAPWHLSIQRNGNRIDIFPTSNKWHHVNSDVRGVWTFDNVESVDRFLEHLKNFKEWKSDKSNSTSQHQTGKTKR